MENLKNRLFWQFCLFIGICFAVHFFAASKLYKTLYSAFWLCYFNINMKAKIAYSESSELEQCTTNTVCMRMQVSVLVSDCILVRNITFLLALVSEGWHKGNSAPFFSSPMVDEERMRPGHWLVSALCFLHCCWLIGRRDIWPVSKPHAINP